MKPTFNDFPIEIRPLTAEEGGGFLATFPDARGAFECWMDAHIADGRPVPTPGMLNASGKFVQRLPRSIHSRLQHQAKAEGVSLNQLVTAYISEGLGRHSAA